MGWENSHMFQFAIGHETITLPEEGHNLAEASFKTIFQSPEFLKILEEREKSGKLEGHMNITEINKILQTQRENKPKEKYSLKTKISQLINSEGQKFTYAYDFGDNWEHTLIVEKIEEEDKIKKYPLCLAGERACPPEDCGGVSGYYHLMQVRKNKNHPEYKELILDWLGEEYDPEFFEEELTDMELREKENSGGWVKFVPLGQLLKEDTVQAQEIKTLFNREHEYDEYLGEIEYTIAELFLKDRTLKDKDITQAIKNIKKNYEQDLDFFQTELEKDIVLQLSIVLQEQSITHREFRLVLDYIRWAIDNRSWMGDAQGYVKWLPYFLKLYNKTESEKYKQEFIKIARRRGVPETKIKDVINPEDATLSDEDKEYSQTESEFFSLQDNEKLNYVLANWQKNPSLIEEYTAELEGKKDFKTAEQLFTKLMEKNNNLPAFEFMLGFNYLNLGNKPLAIKHMNNAVHAIEEIPKEIMPEEEQARILTQMKKAMKETGINQ